MRALIFTLIIISPAGLRPEFKDQLVIWNVGQGQFVTQLSGDVCLHFDMGGEFVDWYELTEMCRTRKNKAYFSHWDFDHINFVKQAARKFPNLCVAALPGGKPKNPEHAEIIFSLKRCELASEVNELRFHVPAHSSSNQSSRIFVSAERILIPGDSTSSEEKYWLQKISSPIEVLVIGHHGSRTSTSKALIQKLKSLRLAIASARRSRYGHPHREIKKRLERNGVSVLRTEDWGNIRVEAKK